VQWFIGVDPLAADYAAWSPYHYVLNNPLVFIDPDGRIPEWYPRGVNGKIQLVAEPGDNLQTLKAYFAGSSRFSEAQLEYAFNNAKGGVFVDLPDDNYSRALAYAFENPDRFAKPDMSNIWDVSLNYNCYHHCLNGTTGGEIYDSKLPWANDMNYSDYRIYFDEATEILNSEFVKTTSNDLVYGETLLAFRPTLGVGEDGVYQHFAAYAGTDKDGNLYIHTKNGDKVTPQIQKLSDFMNELPGGAENYAIDYYKPIEK
jgi:hypothetical protein